MSGKIRWIIVLLATLTVVVLGSQKVAWAAIPPGSDAPASLERSGQFEAGQHKGTVQPPNCEGLTITETGNYPVCGIAILEVQFKTDEDVRVLASIDPVIPPGAGKVMAGAVSIGCEINGSQDPGPHDPHVGMLICFAAHPKNKSVIKFYDEATQTWISLPTLVKDGRACAVANYSGLYVLVKK